MAETNTTVVKKPIHYKAVILQLKTNNNNKMPYDPAIPLLDLYPEKTIAEKYTWAPIFIAALFTIARTWKQPRCPSANEWMKKMWYTYIHTHYIYRMEYYSAIKKLIWVSSGEVDEARACYTEWSKSEREKQIL